MQEGIITIAKDFDGRLVLSIMGEVTWQVSEELKAQILDELKSHQGGEFSDEFDPVIQDAIETIEA